MQKVQHELLVVYANQLLEKEHSGCRALLRDDKVGQVFLFFIVSGLVPIILSLMEYICILSGG